MDTRIVRNLFKEKFGTEGMLYFSPGRINLIGEQWRMCSSRCHR